MIQFQVDILRSMDFAVDVLHRHLADEIFVETGCRLHLDPETMIKTQRIHLISCGFPLVKRLHIAILIAPGVIRNTSRIDE